MGTLNIKGKRNASLFFVYCVLPPRTPPQWGEEGRGLQLLLYPINTERHGGKLVGEYGLLLVGLDLYGALDGSDEGGVLDAVLVVHASVVQGEGSGHTRLLNIGEQELDGLLLTRGVGYLDDDLTGGLVVGGGGKETVLTVLVGYRLLVGSQLEL